MTLNTLESFTGGLDGADPDSLLMDANGDLFGTTSSGGTGGGGTVFELVSTGSGYTFQTLASFNAGDTVNGAAPVGGLTMDAQGNLFGVTQAGGASGQGTVFELANAGSSYALQTLASFSGANGSAPTGGLVADAQGNLFGVTQSGGANGQGSVFEMVKSGPSYGLQTQYSFAGADGATPAGQLITDAQGNLFGVTQAGGASGQGTVFDLDHSGHLTTLASFNGSNGASPLAGLVADDQGDLFGVTSAGGANGVGTVFELVNTGSSYFFATLVPLDNATTGGQPASSLAIDANGDLFGTTQTGGAHGFGTAFELVNTTFGFNLLTLSNFSGPDGAQPHGTLTLDAAGNLIGTTASGGANNAGTVFEISADGGPSEQNNLSLTVDGGLLAPIGQGGTAHVNFATGGMLVGDTGTVTFTDQANHTVVVQVMADQTDYSADLSSLTDGAVDASLQVATNADGTSFNPVAGNTVTLDTTAPVQPASPSDDAVVNGYVNAAHDTADQAIGGMVEAGALVTIYDNGVSLGTAVADNTGAWSYSLGVLPGGSTHSFVVTATDSAGNVSAGSDPLAFTVDTSVAQPGAPGDGAVGNGYVNGAHDTDGQTINGTTEAGAAVAIYDNGIQVGTVIADGSGTWSYQIGALANGSNHSYSVTATDAAGNTSTMSGALNFTVSTSGPVQPGSPGDAAVGNGYVNAAHDTAGQTINGTAQAGASVAVYDNGTQVGTVVADGTGAWSYQVGTLADGSAHSYAVTATDAAGNTSAMSVALSFTVDTSAPGQPGAPTDAGVSHGVVNAAHDTASQTISGTTEAGASVAVYDNGTQVGTAITDGAGAWSYQVGALADGSNHSYAVAATDAAGNTGAMSAVLSFTVNTGAPGQPAAPTDAAVSNDVVNAAHDTASQTIGGTADAGASVAVYDNGTQVGTAVADGSGAWSFQVGALADGSTHSYAVAATDTAGNTGALSQALSFTVDTSAPGQPAVPTDASVSNGVVNAAHDTAAQTISGTTEAGASVAVYDNGTQVGTAVADGSGAWSYQVGALADGSSHSYAVAATDTAGNTGALSQALSFTVDTSAPGQPAAPTDISVSNGVVNAAHDAAAQTISGTTEVGASVAVYDNGTQVGTAVADGSGAWSYQVGALADGSAHSYAVAATDTAGNTGAMSAALSFTVDTSAPGQPGAPIDAAVNNGYVNATHDTAAQTISGTTEAGASVAVYDNGALVTTVTADGAGAWNYQVGVLADGSSHSYAVTATDAAGNASATGATLNFTVGAGAPAQPDAPSDGAVSNGYVNAAHNTASQTIGGTTEAGASVGVFDNGTQVATIVADGAGAWSYQVGTLADGSAHSYAVTATDTAGNTSAMGGALSFTVDASAPGQPGAPTDAGVSNGFVNAAHDTASQTINGATEAGASVAVYDNGTQVGTVVADGSGAWSYQVGALADGSAHSYAVAATDAAGNTGAMSAALSFTVDTTSPGQPAAPADAAVANGFVNAARDTSGQTVSGTTDAGASVAVYDNGALVTTVVADNSGGWNYQVGTLTDGSSHSYAVAATDAAGNTGALSQALSFTVDASTPAAPAGLSDAAVSGGYVNAASDTAAQSLAGTAEDGALVTVYDNGVKLGTATADASTGAWSFNLGVLADGAQSLTATATDAAGNTGAASTALAFTVDTLAPVSAVAGVAIGGDGVATVSGSAEAGSTVDLYDGGSLIGAVTAGSGGTWSYPVGVLAAGSGHSYTVMATDAAGNASAVSSALSYTVAAGPSDPPSQPSLPDPPPTPATPTDSAVHNGYVNAAGDTAKQTIGGTTVADVLVTIYDHGTKVTTVTADDAGAWSYKVGALANGSSHSYAVTATDAAGDVSAMSGALSFTVDTKAPAAPTGLADAAISHGYVNKAHDAAGQTVTGVAATGALVTVYDNGVKLGTTTANASTGAWTFGLGVLADGAQHLTATATDAAGNTSGSAALTFKVDTTAPTPTVTDAAEWFGLLTTISGVSEAGSKVTVLDGGNQIGVATAGANGNWLLLTSLHGSQVHQLTETAVDAAGNIGPSTSTTYWSTQGHSHLVGGSGDDVLIGQQGDTLTGGAGADHFVLNGIFGKETITDFTPGSDEILFGNSLFHSFASMMAHAHLSGGSTVITDAFGDQLTLAGVTPSALHAGDFHFS